jgi:antitoxin component of MazEF toxin-antitoxin module
MMKTILRLMLLLLVIAANDTFADSRVFTLINPNPEEVLQGLHNTYGDKLKADIVRGKLVVVGSKRQLDEVDALLTKLDPAPRALRLRLTEQPPDTTPGTITYSTNNGGGYTIDTVEGAFVAIEYSQIVQQPISLMREPNSQAQQSTAQQSTSAGWWVTIDNVPTQLNALTLRVQLDSRRRAIVLVSYTKEENQERRVFGNTVSGDLGSWIPLLPRPTNTDDNTISSGPKRGEQLYLRVDKNFK